MKKRTLNQTWILCLRMWRWISKEWPKSELDVCGLKERWLEANGFKYSISNSCFFCDFAEDECFQCPGQLIDSHFSCMNPKYDYDDKPVAFYKELLRLNRIRKA